MVLWLKPRKSRTSPGIEADAHLVEKPIHDDSKDKAKAPKGAFLASALHAAQDRHASAPIPH